MKISKITLVSSALFCVLLFLIGSGILHAPQMKWDGRTLGKLAVGTNEFSFVVEDAMLSSALQVLSFGFVAKPHDGDLSNLSGEFRISDGEKVWQEHFSETNLVGYLSDAEGSHGKFPLYGRREDGRQKPCPLSYEQGKTITCQFVVDRLPDTELSFQVVWATDKKTIWR